MIRTLHLLRFIAKINYLESKFRVLLSSVFFVESFDTIIQAWDLSISPSFKTLKLLAFKVSPLEVISVIISEEPVKGYVSVESLL